MNPDYNTLISIFFYFSLGSSHDGSGNTCDPDELNIMTAYHNPFGSNYLIGSYIFSSCSIEDFNDHIDDLN